MRIRKRYRVTIDVDVDVEDITMEVVRARVAERNAARLKDNLFLHTGVISVPSDADIAAQRALLDELTRDPECLDRWLRSSILLELADGLNDTLVTEDERSLLHPAIERLHPRFRHWWRQTLWSGEDDMFERGGDFYDSVHTGIEAIILREIDRPGV